MRRFHRQRPFLEGLLKEADHNKREDLLYHANKDQINAVSELVLNFLKRKIPTSPHVIRQLAVHKDTLRSLARRKHSVKRRKEVLAAQTGGTFWKGLHRCYQSCLKSTNHFK